MPRSSNRKLELDKGGLREKVRCELGLGEPLDSEEAVLAWKVFLE